MIDEQPAKTPPFKKAKLSDGSSIRRGDHGTPFPPRISFSPSPLKKTPVKASLQSQRQALPIYSGMPYLILTLVECVWLWFDTQTLLVREDLLALIEKERAVVIVGETGSGKTTRGVFQCFSFCTNKHQRFLSICMRKESTHVPG